MICPSRPPKWAMALMTCTYWPRVWECQAVRGSGGERQQQGVADLPGGTRHGHRHRWLAVAAAAMTKVVVTGTQVRCGHWAGSAARV